MLTLTPIAALVSLQDVSFCHSRHRSMSLLFLKRSACSCNFLYTHTQYIRRGVE